MPILAANARTAPPGRLCREVDVFARDRLEERRYGYDAKGRLVRVEHREGPTSELVAEERHRLSRAGHIVRTDRREWLGDRWHGTSTRFRRDRAGRVVWSKARGSINDAAQVFRYDRQGRLIEERDGALRKTIRQAAWPASGGDPIGLPFPSAWPAEAVITEALEESRWDEARHLEVTSNGTLLYERKVTHGEVVATGYTVGPDGVEVISERHFELSFYESPLRRVETRTIPAGASGEPALVERWEALGPGEPTLTRRTARLETGCLE